MNSQDLLRSQIKELHGTKGIQYNYFAKEIGVSQCHFSKWLHGNRNLSAEPFMKLRYLYNNMAD